MPCEQTKSTKNLEEKALQIRKSIIQMLSNAGSGHPAGALGMADVFVILYFKILKHNPKKPNWSERDRVFLSNGHICPVIYSTMAEAGYFPKQELETLRKLHSRLQGHPHNLSLPGIENSSGPLGQGLSIAVGSALAGKLNKNDYTVYCFISDGELDEGQSWEAFMCAAKFKLDNLIFILDRNYIQIDGFTSKIMPLEPLVDKLESFGLQVFETDGHDHKNLVKVFQNAKKVENKPSIIVAHTIPGKGVSFMENNPDWHGRAPSKKEARTALSELD